MAFFIKCQSLNFILRFELVLLFSMLQITFPKKLQHSHMIASEGQDIAKRVVKCLQTMRSDRDWELFWEYVNQGAKKLDLPDAEPPRKRRRPRKYEEGLAPPEFPETAEAHYHKIWAEVHDCAISVIKKRFDQPGYKTAVALKRSSFKSR